MTTPPAPSSAPGLALDTVEDWAEQYITSTDLRFKCCPPPPPRSFRREGVRYRSVPTHPGRPQALQPRPRAGRKSGRGLSSPRRRAELLHTFWHHELQAAELMCWALLKFHAADPAFRAGLLGICQDEIRHMGLYQERLEALGHQLGDFAVRDWFWERVPTCGDALGFVCLMGLGLESANLEHAARFEQEFRAVGDLEAARVQEQVGREEIAHARFAAHWYQKWRGELTFADWKAALPAPLSPLLMRGTPLNGTARAAAGQPEAFIEALSAWQPDDSGC